MSSIMKIVFRQHPESILKILYIEIQITKTNKSFDLSQSFSKSIKTVSDAIIFPCISIQDFRSLLSFSPDNTIKNIEMLKS